MSFIYQYFWSEEIKNYEPTEKLVHQKFLIMKQLKASNLRLRKVKEIKEIEDGKNDQVNSWKNNINIIKRKKLQKNKNNIKNNI